MPNANNEFINYEKSANYFDNESVPKRIRALINKPKLVVLLMNPIYRAYSWYQHMKAHNDSTAIKYSFYEILQSNKTDSSMYSIKNRCLDPGIYYKHLRRWLKEFLPRQLFFVDSETLKNDPFKCLNELQKFFGLRKIIDYRDLIVFSEKKSFYCLKIPNSMKCLGYGKGRKYPDMDKESYEFLKKFYTEPNKRLKELLKRHGYEIPKWLDNKF